MSAELAGPDPVDVHVGRRVRARRKVLGISQGVLAERIGVTFQQVQKYERGHNRISVSKLYRIAQALATPLEFFFEGLDDPSAETGATKSDPTVARNDALFSVTGGVELAGAFVCISPRVRAAVVGLVKACAEDAKRRCQRS
ncbi:Transcriptional regulator, contains XRE-family HTH domain [Tistlia consotensis]|uniref:Transcriptional regulator, contains XRE-family HTH domain n=1 Tax=Tistlia consotensis USBA 355 TaxID=560819 RepID=A0A1Y6CQY1_9PROT|nr:helix-turn-helix transcriptional regulator [Tistlia consotensis]SMF84122.1 Transcriptional regulator, contains XRE-family HTH domain [Tistlia consotensis USBA 355]SNS35956.1 Transcriptional regulator, contains XRE-family HTH domain [Tistlia consotensis]